MSTTGRKVGWGLVGASDIAARFMIGAIRSQPDAEVTAVMSRSPEWSAIFARAHSVPHHHSAVAELLANPAVDVVYVSSDNRLHREQTVAAARAGKPVLCEKPLALDPADATAMVAACRDAGVVFGTNHHLRTAAAIQTIRRMVAEGAVGRPLAARVSHLANLPEHLRKWRIHEPAAGGGPINDMGTHDFDALRFVLRREIVEVSAMTVSQGLAAAGIEDGVMASMRFDDGLLASFHAAYNIGFVGSAMDVHGSEGSLLCRNAMSATGGAELVLRTASGDRTIDIGPQGIAYEGTVRAFIDAVKGRGQPAATGFDGLQSLLVATAVRESAKSGRAVAITNVMAHEREETRVE
jgi:1,5-anhydro-D-fructose reductase (1,5-anhydro-D-mannitol-forming)